MKNIKSLCLLLAGIIIGLLVLACNDPLDNISGKDISRSIESKSGNETNELQNEDLFEEEWDFYDENYYYLTVFNPDGKMQNIRLPRDEKDREDEPEDQFLEPDIVETDFDVGMRGRNITLFIIGDGFTSTMSEPSKFFKEAGDAADNLKKTYPFNLFGEFITVEKALWYSNESGVSREPIEISPDVFIPGPMVDNYYGSTFWYIWGKKAPSLG